MVLDKPLDGNHGGKHPKGADFITSGIPFIMASDINNGKIDTIGCSFITKEQADSLDKGFSITGDVLLTHKATLGRTAIVGSLQTPYIMLTPQVTYYRILKSDILYNKYLKYYFDTNFFQETFANYGDSGSTRSYVGITAQGGLPIMLPTFPEQKAIAAVLSSLDDKIDLLHRQNATLEAMAEALFRQWFVVEAKEEWEGKRLGEVFNIYIGRTPPRKEQWCFSDSPTKHIWVSIRDMGLPGVFISDSSEYLKKEAVYEYSVPIIPKDTVLLSFKMTVGRVKITTEPMYSNEAIACFAKKTNSLLSSEFLYIFLKRFNYDELGSTSSIVTAVNSAIIKEIFVQIPPQNLKVQFDSIVHPVFEKIRSNQTQICTLEKLRDTLLPKLMTGEIRVV